MMHPETFSIHIQCDKDKIIAEELFKTLVPNLNLAHHSRVKWSEYPFVGVRDNTLIFYMAKSEMAFSRICITTSELWRIFVEERRPAKRVRLNESYTAEITANKIKVGCTEFPVSVLEDLRKAVSEAQF